jgi:hypothetical protein
MPSALSVPHASRTGASDETSLCLLKEGGFFVPSGPPDSTRRRSVLLSVLNDLRRTGMDHYGGRTATLAIALRPPPYLSGLSETPATADHPS